MKNLLYRTGYFLRNLWSYALILAIAAALTYWTFTFEGWFGILLRVLVVVFFLTCSNWDLVKTMKDWDPRAKIKLLITTQIAFIGLYFYLLWFRNAGLYENPMAPFLRDIRFSIPFYLDMFINPGDITQEYLGANDFILSLGALAAMIFASVVAAVINVNYQKMEDEHVEYETSRWHKGAGRYSQTHKTTRTTYYSDGTASTSTSSHTTYHNDKDRWINGYHDINNPEARMYWRPLIPFLGYLFAPVITFAAILIYHLYKMLKPGAVKIISISAIVLFAVGLNVAGNMAEEGDNGIPRTFTPSISQIKLSMDDWNAQAPELLDNYSMDVKRVGSLSLFPSVEIRQIRENGRTIRYYNVKDKQFTWKGEYWVVTEKGQTVIYRKYKDIKESLRSGIDVNYDKLMGIFDPCMLDKITEKNLSFFTDERYGQSWANQANENKLILKITDRKEWNKQLFYAENDNFADFYFTDNKITIYDFFIYGERFRAKVSYGNVNAELLQDIDQFADVPSK